MRKYYLLVMLSFPIIFIMCNNKDNRKRHSSYEDIVCSIDMGKINKMSAIWREINFLIINYYTDDKSFEVCLQRKYNKLYLIHEDEKVRFDKYKKSVLKPRFDSIGLDITNVKYVYDLMSNYPIKRIAYINEFNVSRLTIDSIRFFYIPDTKYINKYKLDLIEIGKQWYIESDP